MTICEIMALAEKHAAWAIERRRDLHRVPELDWDLPKTSRIVTDALDEMGIGYSRIRTGVVAIVAGVIELVRVHLPQGLVLLGGGLVCLGLCALLFLLMKLITVGAAKLCKWLWTGVKSLFVGKKGK